MIAIAAGLLGGLEAAVAGPVGKKGVASAGFAEAFQQETGTVGTTTGGGKEKTAAKKADGAAGDKVKQGGKGGVRGAAARAKDLGAEIRQGGARTTVAGAGSKTVAAVKGLFGEVETEASAQADDLEVAASTHKVETESSGGELAKGVGAVVVSASPLALADRDVSRFVEAEVTVAGSERAAGVNAPAVKAPAEIDLPGTALLQEIAVAPVEAGSVAEVEKGARANETMGEAKTEVVVAGSSTGERAKIVSNDRRVERSFVNEPAGRDKATGELTKKTNMTLASVGAFGEVFPGAQPTTLESPAAHVVNLEPTALRATSVEVPVAEGQFVLASLPLSVLTLSKDGVPSLAEVKAHFKSGQETVEVREPSTRGLNVAKDVAKSRADRDDRTASATVAREQTVMTEDAGKAAGVQVVPQVIGTGWERNPFVPESRSDGEFQAAASASVTADLNVKESDPGVRSFGTTASAKDAGKHLEGVYPRTTNARELKAENSSNPMVGKGPEVVVVADGSWPAAMTVVSRNAKPVAADVIPARSEEAVLAVGGSTKVDRVGWVVASRPESVTPQVAEVAKALKSNRDIGLDVAPGLPPGQAPVESLAATVANSDAPGMVAPAGGDNLAAKAAEVEGAANDIAVQGRQERRSVAGSPALGAKERKAVLVPLKADDAPRVPRSEGAISVDMALVGSKAPAAAEDHRSAVTDSSPTLVASTSAIDPGTVAGQVHGSQAVALNANVTNPLNAHNTPSSLANTGVDGTSGTASANPLGAGESLVSPLAHTTLQATPTVLEVGVPGGTHGWLKIRAEIGEGGAVQASLSATTHAGQETLRRELPALNAYLDSERLPVNVQVAHGLSSGNGSAMTDGGGFSMGSGLSQNSEQGGGRSQAEMGAPSASGGDGAADRGGRQQEGSVEGGRAAETVSRPTAQGRDTEWKASQGYGTGSSMNGGSWLNVMA